MNTISILKAKQFLSDINFSNFKISPQTENFSTDVFKLTKENEVLYMRILSKEENVEPQCFVHNLLLEKGIKVPKIVYYERKVEIFDNRDVMIVKELKGRSVLEDENNFSEDEKVNILKEAGRDLAKINMIEVEKYGDICEVKDGKLIGFEDSYEEYTLERVPKKLRSLVENGVITNELSERLLNYILKNKNLLHIDGNSYLSHGDFHLEHIYQYNGKYTGILDFGDIRGTSKYHDLGFFYTHFRKYFAYLIEGYEEIHKLPDNYMENVLLEAVVFGIFHLNWLVKNRPEKIEKSKIWELFEKIQDVN